MNKQREKKKKEILSFLSCLLFSITVSVRIIKDHLALPEITARNRHVLQLLLILIPLWRNLRLLQQFLVLSPEAGTDTLNPPINPLLYPCEQRCRKLRVGFVTTLRHGPHSLETLVTRFRLVAPPTGDFLPHQPEAVAQPEPPRRLVLNACTSRVRVHGQAGENLIEDKVGHLLGGSPGRQTWRVEGRACALPGQLVSHARDEEDDPQAE